MKYYKPIHSFLNRWLFLKIFFCLSYIFTLSHAAQDIYSFSSDINQKRFMQLTGELRCLVCQNQNLAESNAPLAIDLRDQIFQQIEQGYSNQAILQYLIDRYGSFILYRPPFTASTILLWLLPFFLLFSSIGYLIYFIYQKQRN